MKTIPELMRAQGYFTFNSGKDDYNFHYDRRNLYDVGTKGDYVAGMNGWQGNRAEHWKSYTKDVWGARADKSRPWFGQIQIDGGKGDRRYLDDADFIVKDSVSLPPYFPSTPALHQAWSVHFENARGSDVRISIFYSNSRLMAKWRTPLFSFSLTMGTIPRLGINSFVTREGCWCR
jgi:hypothetical protein